jgi:2-haloacid dehalogenase
MKPKAFVFDAYGTLFDPNSFVLKCDEVPGNIRDLAALWRRKQLEFTWLRSLMERYEDFWEITAAALRAAAGQLGMDLSDAHFARLMQAYVDAAPFPDAMPALESLAGSPLAVLSNGSPKMLEALVGNSGLEPYFIAVISVDRAKTYKPSPRVYALASEILNLPPREILFVSSNSWDAAGAKAFGYRVCWCNRDGAKEEGLGFPADFTVSRLDQILHHIPVPQ